MQAALGHEEGGHGPKRSMRREWKVGTRCDSSLYLVVAVREQRNM